MNFVVKIALSVMAFWLFEQSSQAGRSLIKNAQLLDGIEGWNVSSDELEVYLLKECIEFKQLTSQTDKSLIAVRMEKALDPALITLKADEAVAAFSTLHYFVKVGFASATGASFIVEVVDPDGFSISQESYNADDESLYHDLLPITGVLAEKAGIYTLAIQAKSTSPFGPCFFYYAQLGTKASEIAIEGPREFPPGFDELGHKAMVGKKYTISSQANFEFLCISKDSSALEVVEKPGSDHEQLFELIASGYDSFKIRSIKSKRCLEYDPRTKRVKAAVCKKKERQSWILENSDQGSYYIRPQNSDDYLELNDNELKVEQSIFGCDYQKFRFVVQNEGQSDQS